MCGRYTLANTEDFFARFQSEDQDLDLALRYSVAPEQAQASRGPGGREPPVTDAVGPYSLLV